MKKIMVTVFFMLAGFSLAHAQETAHVEETAPTQEAAGHGDKKQEFSLALETSQITYKEPDFMKEHGIMAGMSGAYYYVGFSPWRLGADLEVRGGQLRYSSNGTGSMKGIKDYIVEIRGIAGYDIDLKHLLLTPYLGVGYRYLSDNSRDKQTTTGDWGYRRESNYFYLPLGVAATIKIAKGWTVTPRGEYDVFIRGAQFSLLRDVDPDYNNVHNKQSKGYGLRGSLKVTKTLSKKLSLSIEPFVKYWKVKQSRNADLVYDNVIVGYAYEPRNISTEIGCKIGVEF